MGLMRTARHAGSQQASIATAISNRPLAANVSGSVGVIPKNKLDRRRARAFEGLLEQLRSELPEILAPIDPGVRAFRFLVNNVEPVLLEHRHRGAGRFDEEIVLAGGEPE